MTTKDQDVQVTKKEGAPAAELTRDLPVFTPATDICKRADAILVTCDMPGVDERHVDIQLENRVLTITGYQDAEQPAELELLHRGYVPGAFRRAFTLGADIDAAKIAARISKGVLRVELPKAVEAQPRKIQVTTGD